MCKGGGVVRVVGGDSEESEGLVRTVRHEEVRCRASKLILFTCFVCKARVL